MQKYFIVFICLLFSGNAFSDLHFEPYAGLGVLFKGESGKIEDQSLKENFYIKTNLGGRVGYKKAGLAFGLDISAGYHHPLGSSDKKSFWTALPGLFVSYEPPLLFRFYGVLIPHGFLFGQNGEELEKSQPALRGLKLGVSVFSAPFLSLNVEYEPLFYIEESNHWNWLHSGTAYLNILL